MSEIPWAGNARERAVKKRGWGFYASHIGSTRNDGSENIYMRRWILLLPFGLGTLRVHQIMRSDDDRHLHDHPFDFTSFLLSGGYFESIPCDGRLLFGNSVWPVRQTKVTHYRPRFSIVRKKAEDLHALTLTCPVWTLVYGGPKRREWGFATELGWIHNERYFDHFQHRAEWKDVSA